MNQTRKERTGARPARQRRRAPLGSPALAQELIAAIGRVTRQPIRQVIVTHCHADHIYGLQAFKTLGATITAHRDGQAYLHSDTTVRRMQAGRAELEPFEAAYVQADGSRFEHLPLFKAANRINAYNTYLLMERSTP